VIGTNVQAYFGALAAGMATFLAYPSLLNLVAALYDRLRLEDRPLRTLHVIPPTCHEIGDMWVDYSA